MEEKIWAIRIDNWKPKKLQFSNYAVKKKLVMTEQQPKLPIRRWIRQAGMSILQPDPQILWNSFALRIAKSAIRESLRNDEPFEAIYVTGPPFSSFLLGRSLKRRFGLPLVLDFRDEWLLASQYLDNHQQTGLAYRRQLAMFHQVLRAADAVLATNDRTANATILMAACFIIRLLGTVGGEWFPDATFHFFNGPLVQTKAAERNCFTRPHWN